ncbi:MAG TPA: FHA domain-containing serine/threonine-protein kinase [Solirubrobacteraceae bacterium]|nr:FHA domain-containing serine/threonine-protein kinase [Solirubrobacteraceae bacterium]
MADGPLRVGSEIAGYRVQSLLGRGGMGVVYLAERPQGGLCALKVLSAGPSLDVSSAARFKREARYAAKLEHANVLDLYDVGETADGRPFFAMQYVDGEDLGALLAREGPLAPAQALAILAQVGAALDAAHALGIVHRDVKPGNIIVGGDPDGGPHVYLTDFGLGKSPHEDSVALTRQGQFVGTMLYTAPEEILGQQRDHRVDVYSLGCVLYELLVGSPPFLRELDLDVLYAHIGDPRPSVHAERPELAPALDAVIARAMAIAPAERYGTCAELLAAAHAAAERGADAPRAAGDPAARSGAADEPEALRIIGREGLGAGRELLVEGELVLGRLVTLGGALAEDRGISRNHARLWRTDGGALMIEDAGSANGTLVNGTRIESPHRLRAGDVLQIGAAVFAVESRPASAPPAGLVEPIVDDTLRAGPARSPEPLGEAEREGPASRESATAESVRSGSSRLTVRIELDLERGEAVLAIEGGPSARIVSDGDSWRISEL